MRSSNQILHFLIFHYTLLLGSPSKEVRVLAKIVQHDPRSSTCLNLKYLSQLSGLSNPEQWNSVKIREHLPVLSVPDSEKWRLGLITNLFKLKREKYHSAEDFQNISRMIDSLCSTQVILVTSIIFFLEEDIYLCIIIFILEHQFSSNKSS